MIGRIPPHGSDAGTFLLAECFGCKSLTLVKDVKGLYDRDPKLDSTATFMPEASISEIRQDNFETLPFDCILPDLLDSVRLVQQVQIVNGCTPELIAAALDGEHVGTIIYAES